MRILKRKRGDGTYYYLQHSFRDGKKVITKEKYLGGEIPKNIYKLKEEFARYVKTSLNEKLEKIKKHFQAEWKRIPESVREKELEEVSIAFTYNTNAIEGSTITLEEAREIIHDKISPNRAIRDVRETEAHSKVFLQMLKRKEELSSELILDWHKNIFSETKPELAGKYRDYLVRVGSYLAPDWQEVERMMRELVEFVNKNKELNPVELAGRAHYGFEKIHPFGDGNGRLGRLLINFILWHSGYPMLIIEYKKRRSYYKALQKEEAGFVSYLVRRYLFVNKKRY